MGKKRKKSSPAPSVAPSQPALTEEAAAALVAETPEAMPTPTPAVAEAKPAEEAKAVVEAAPEPEPEPVKAEPAKPEAPPEPIVAPEAAPEPVIEAAAPASEAAPPTARPKKRVVKKKKRTTKPPAVTREALDQKIDRLEAKLEEKKEEVAKAAREAFGSNPALDDTSVPPVDLEIHDEFFAAGESSHAPPKDASGAYTAIDARHAQKMTPHAVARRAHLSRYVMWVVGGAMGILLLGFTIRSLRHRSDEPVRHEVTHVAQAAQATEANVAKAVEPQAVVAPPPKTDEAKVDEKVDEAKTATNEAKPEGSAAAEKTAEPNEQPKGDLPPEKPKNAYQEKVSAKAALERGANGAAIAAGERSVSLDPSDAEAWLVLGAAYQASGNVGQAKRCFKSCVSQGKRGPVSDCRDMLSSL